MVLTNPDPPPNPRIWGFKGRLAEETAIHAISSAAVCWV
ncbi:hypothetical protein SPLC1_S103200 [Arthrospira platensis C1]|nr:hypothetical protein SPLC1_S103200 [Arthrospira platensis C1]